MNLQKEPFQEICEALARVLKARMPQLKDILAGWPDPKWVKTDGNLPSVFFVHVSETSKNVANRLDIHKTEVNADGAGYMYTEQMRLFILLQNRLLP